MYRVLLTYLSILAVAAGPLLCCCTAGRLMAACIPTHQTGHAARVVHSCCSTPTTPTADTAPAGGPNTPDHPDRQCPCKSGPVKVEATPTVAADIDAGASLRVLSLDVILPYTATDVAAFALGGVEVADGPAGLSCYPSADDLLFSHHKLRC